MSDRLVALASLFSQLALLAVGGVNAVVPEMQRQVVQVHGWMTARDFAALFALAQAAPGPNMLVVTLVGWRVAGLAGAAVATLSLIAPACLLTFVVSGAWQRFRAARWRAVLQAALTPITVGLLSAAGVVLARGAVHGVGGAAICLVTTAVSLDGRLHPLWLLAAGTALGALGVL